MTSLNAKKMKQKNIPALQKKNRIALEEQCIKAYEELARPLFRYCYYRIGDQERANDLVQEIFCRFWKYMVAGHEIKNAKAFLYRIANNITIDEIRKKKIFSLNQMMENGFPLIDHSKKLGEDYFARNEILEAIRSLDKRYQDVILMKYIQGFSNKEISLAFNETVNNIYIRIHRGFRKVREILQREYHYSLS